MPEIDPPTYLNSCANCPCNSKIVVPRHDNESIFGVVVDWPSEAEEKHDQWLVGPRGGGAQLLRVMLNEYVDLDEIYVTSALNCRPNPTKKAMHKNGMNSCRERLIEELRDAGVQKVLCTGPVGYGALMSLQKLPAITTVRGRWKKAFGMDVMATLPPGFAVAQPEYFRDIERDVIKFFETDGLQPWPDIEIWTPESLKEVDEAFKLLYSYPYVSSDLETTGFSPHSCWPIAAGFGVLEDDNNATVVVLEAEYLKRKDIWRRLEKLINGQHEVVFHNAKFDLQFYKTQLEQRGLKYDPQNIHDTMMLNYQLDERPMGKYKAHSLEAISRVRYDAPDYGIDVEAFLQEWEEASEDKSRELQTKLNTYMALDVYYTGRLFRDLWNDCMKEDERLLDQYEKVLMPGTIALASVEHHGILLDKGMYEGSRKILQSKSSVLLERIQKVVGDDEFNPGSPLQVKNLIYDEWGMDVQHALEVTAASVTLEEVSGRKEGIRSRGTYTDPSRLKSSATAAPVLKMLARGYPEHQQFLDDVCEWRNLTKNAGTYVEGLLRRLDVDGRIHGTLNIHGTASGRLSSTNPNLQNMPPASHTGIPIRSGFIAAEGYSFIDCDYKQLEVRVAAELSGDPVMIEMFESGGDPHGETSKRIYGREDVSSYERMLGKIITFGLLYGRSPDSIATGAEAEDIVARGGKRWAPEDVREFFGNLLGDWKVYAKWRQECREAPYKDGEITFSIGRKRRTHFIPKHDGGHIGRQGINTPCQGTASDFCLYALIRLHEKLKPYDAQVISTVHDSLLVECRDDQLEVVAPLVEETMTKDTLWPTRVPLAVDLKISKKWNESEDAEYGWTSSQEEEVAA